MINFQETIFDQAYKGSVDVVKSKVDENPDLVASKDANERLLIHWSSLAGCDQLVKYLLDRGSPVDPEDDIGMTPLILAASANRFDVVKLLLERGANVNARSHEGHSALQYAASKGLRQVLELLLDEGADVNIADKRKATPLHRAASRGDVAVVAALLGRDELVVNAADVYGNTPLHLACEENNMPAANALIRRGARIDALNRDGKTPLDLATPAACKFLGNALNAEE